MRHRLILLLAVMVFAGCSPSDDDLIKDLRSSNSRVRRAAATKLIMRHGDSELVRKLTALLRDEDEQVVFIATQILGSLSDTTAVRPLGELISHSNPEIRAAACWSLGTIGHDSALEYLVPALEDENDHVRFAAVVALGNLHCTPAVKHLFTMLSDPVDSVRVRAIQSLYYYRLDRDAGILASDFAPVVVDKSDLVRYVAVQALGGAWEDARGWVYGDSTAAGELLLDALNDRNRAVRIEAINSLKKLRYRKAVPLLKKMYDMASVDEEVAISEAIKEITGEDFPPRYGKTE